MRGHSSHHFSDDNFVIRERECCNTKSDLRVSIHNDPLGSGLIIVDVFSASEENDDQNNKDSNQNNSDDGVIRHFSPLVVWDSHSHTNRRDIDGIRKSRLHALLLLEN
jgi:hypothetical protein